jgi:toxin-antitoxin system PIN domain toxin
MAALPDISVLLPLTYGAHAHHAVALAWLDTLQREGDVVLCRVTQLGLLRLLNNPVAMGADVQSSAEAWKTIDALLADERFRFDDEPEGFEIPFRALSTPLSHQPKRWQDTYLAAFAIASDIELVTFDTGFRSFPGLRHHILTPERPRS